MLRRGLPRISRRVIEKAVMPRQYGEGDLQHNLAGAFRPAFAAFGFLQTFQMTAYVDQHVRHLWPGSLDGAPVALPGGNHAIAERGRIARRRSPAASSGRRVRPVRRDARVHRTMLEVGPQPFARPILIVRDHGRAIPVLTATQPCERTFRIVDHDRAARGALTDRTRLMLCAKAIR